MLNILQSLFQYKHHLLVPDLLPVEHALKINVAKITNNIFFKFLLNIIFSPGLIVEIFQIIKHYSSFKLHKKYPYFDNNEDQDGSEASVLVLSFLSLYPVISIDQSDAEKPSPLEPAFVSL